MIRSLITQIVFVPSMGLAAPTQLSCYTDYSIQAKYQWSALSADGNGVLEIGRGPDGRIVVASSVLKSSGEVFVTLASMLLAAADGAIITSQLVHNAYLSLEASEKVIGQAEEGVVDSPELEELAAEVKRLSGKDLTMSEVSGRLKLLSISRSICKNESEKSAYFLTYKDIAKKIGEL